MLRMLRVVMSNATCRTHPLTTSHPQPRAPPGGRSREARRRCRRAPRWWRAGRRRRSTCAHRPAAGRQAGVGGQQEEQLRGRGVLLHSLKESCFQIPDWMHSGAGASISAAMQQSWLGEAGCREAAPFPPTSQMPQEPWEQPRVMSAPASLATCRQQRHWWMSASQLASGKVALWEHRRRQKACSCCGEWDGQAVWSRAPTLSLRTSHRFWPGSASTVISCPPRKNVTGTAARAVDPPAADCGAAPAMACRCCLGALRRLIGHQACHWLLLGWAQPAADACGALLGAKHAMWAMDGRARVSNM